MDSKRYVVHDFLVGSPILVDRVDKTLTFYGHNIYGQIYNLANPDHYEVSAKWINSIISRTNNPGYNFLNSPVVDRYVYQYLMTPEQQARCGCKPEVHKGDELIIMTDSYTEAIKKMCVWVFENSYPDAWGDKDTERSRLLRYCENFLADSFEMRPSRKPQADN